MTYVVTVLVGVGLVALGYDRYRAWRHKKRAFGVSCPVCGSDDLDGVTEDDLYGVEYLDDDFECRECGVVGEAMEGRAAERLELLKRLDGMRVTSARLREQTAISTLLFGTSDEPQDLEYFQRELSTLWEDLHELSETYSDAFELKVDSGDGETLEERMRQVYEEFEMPGSVFPVTISDIGEVWGFWSLRTQCRAVDDVLMAIEDAVSEDLRRHQKGQW